MTSVIFRGDYPARITEQSDLLWAFLTHPNPESLDQARIETFLLKLSIASDGLAFIQYCFESHCDALDAINLSSLYYQDSNGHSIFSLLIANPFFNEWLFGYNITIHTEAQELHHIVFIEQPPSIMTPLRNMIMHSPLTELALESTLTQKGTLFFWLYFLQQDALRGELFQAVLAFILSSPNGLYTYDSLGPLLHDMLRSPTMVSEAHKTLVATFLSSRLVEQVKAENEACWLTAALVLNHQELRGLLDANTWLLGTLRHDKHWRTFCCIMHSYPDIIAEFDARREQPRAASPTGGRFFSGPLPEEEGPPLKRSRSAKQPSLGAPVIRKNAYNFSMIFKKIIFIIFY